jgi:hypothetical protein
VRPRRSIWPDRPLTGMEVGLILGVVALVVFGCLGCVGLSFLTPSTPAPVYPLPTVSSS